jgi:pimeloyl-ACP methyl ester carboxylesterase
MVLFNVPVVAEQFLDQFGRQMLASHPDRDQVLELMSRPGAATAGFGWYRANASPKVWVSGLPKLPDVGCPVMGVWSSKDFALSETQMTGTASYVTGSWRYERIEGAGHWMQLDAPEELNRLLLDFLS